MNLHRTIIEAAKRETGTRAGIVPFLADGRCLFAATSSADGSQPAIAKGQVGGEEDAKAAAIREGEEKLGLRRTNMAAAPFLGWSGKLTGPQEMYPLEVYAVLVKDPDAFDEPGSTVWLTRSQFTTKGRKSHTEIMEKIFDKIEGYLSNK